MELLRFIQEEVERQGWGPPHSPENTLRTAYMMEAWGWALATSRFRALPKLSDAHEIAKRVEPVNAHGYRSHGVQIMGVPIGSHAPEIGTTLVALFEELPHVDTQARWRRTDADYERGVNTLDSWYVSYESIHPWSDGNGRSGKVLYNWIHGTLLDPVLVDDYFGHGVP